MSGPGPPWLFLELLALLAATSPLGHLVTRALERARLWPHRPTLLERLTLAPFLGGAVAYLLAYTPPGLYSGTVLTGILAVAGALGAADLWTHREPLRRLLGAEGPAAVGPLAVAGAFLAAYCALRAPVGFANTFDGSVQADFLVVLLHTHHAAWQLVPFAPSFGVIYPQGTAAWLGLPVLAFGWSPASAPTELTPMFLALSVLAAASWAVRWAGEDPVRARLWGLATAGFFAAVATWPRLVIFGSYDFAFGLPLLFLWLSWCRPGPSAPGSRGWVGLGLVLAVTASLSAAVAEFAALWLFATVLWRLRPGGGGTPRAFLGAVGTTALGLTGVLPSLAGALVWWRFPSHVLTAVGPAGPYLPSGGGATGLGVLLADLDPFVPFGAKLAPGPVLWVVALAALLGGLAVALHRLAGEAPAGAERAMAAQTLGLAGVAALLTALLLAGAAGLAGGVGAFASLGESSLLFFIALELVGLGAVLWLVDRASGRATPDPRGPSGAPSQRPAAPGGRAVAAALALLLVFGAGLGGSVAELPAYATTLDHALANVTASDVQALQWAGAHLTGADRVLVAPGSAGQYLPVYSVAQIVYPMNPAPADRVYWQATAALQAGTMNSTVRADLAELAITVVFVTGASTVLWPPFVPAPLVNDPAGFPLLFHSGDAYLFAVASP